MSTLARRNSASLSAFKIPAVVGLTVTGTILGGWWLVPEVGVSALGWLAAATAIVLILRRPFWGLLLMAFAIPLANVLVIGGEVTWARLIGLLVFAAWVSHKLIRREPWADVLSSKIAWPGFAFGLFAFTSLIWAADHASSA